MIWTAIILYWFVDGPFATPGRYDLPRYSSFEQCVRALPAVTNKFYLDAEQRGDKINPRAAMCVNDNSEMMK